MCVFPDIRRFLNTSKHWINMLMADYTREEGGLHIHACRQYFTFIQYKST